MSEQDVDVIEPLAVQSALDGQGGVQGEPVLAQLDEWSRYQVMQLLYEYGEAVNPETGMVEMRPVKCRYPDVENAAGYALSHHNLLMNMTWEESRSMILDWRGLYYKPLRYKYKRDEDAQTILTALDQVFGRNIIGGSGNGAHQNFLAKLVNTIREVTVGRKQE